MHMKSLESQSSLSNQLRIDHQHLNLYIHEQCLDQNVHYTLLQHNVTNDLLQNNQHDHLQALDLVELRRTDHDHHLAQIILCSLKEYVVTHELMIQLQLQLSCIQLNGEKSQQYPYQILQSF